jgi:hypothetical protein
LTAKPKGKRPLGKSRLRRKHDVKMDLREMGWGDMKRINLAKDRDQWRSLVNMVVNVKVHKMLGSFWIAKRLEVSKQGLGYS